jgi:predicted ester cyclase
MEEVWSGGNLAVLDEIIAPEYILHGAADPTTPPGPEGARRITAAFRDAFPDLQGVIEDLIAEGDRVVCRWTARATHQGPFAGVAPTHRPVTLTGIEIVRVVNGQIVEGWDEVDLLGLMEQLGAATTSHG